MVDFSKYQKTNTVNSEIINNEELEKPYDKNQLLYEEEPRQIKDSEEKEARKKAKNEGVWVEIPISKDSSSRLISGVCAVFKIKGYNRMSKEQAIDSMIEHLKTQKEQYLFKRSK